MNIKQTYVGRKKESHAHTKQVAPLPLRKQAAAKAKTCYYGNGAVILDGEHRQRVKKKCKPRLLMANKGDCRMGGSSQCCNCTVIILFNELAGYSKHICYNTAYGVDLYKREGSWFAQKTVSNVFMCWGKGGGGDCKRGDCPLKDHHSDINIYSCLCVYWWIWRQWDLSLKQLRWWCHVVGSRLVLSEVV